MADSIDLHMHTTASDGRYSPKEVVEKAAALGLSAIAICDHDTIGGLAEALEAAEQSPRLKVIPGIEVSTHAPGDEVHMLGYFIDYKDPEFVQVLDGLRNSRLERARSIVKKLNELGIDIKWQRVQELAGDASVGRPHIAQAMIEKGCIAEFKEAFDRYIGLGGPAYVERHKITPVEAAWLILKAKGLPVLAHPLTVKEPEPLIAALKEAGLVGIEVYYNSFTPAQRQHLAGLADKHGLVATGGSDYHGIDDANETMIGAAGTPAACLDNLTAVARQRGLNTYGL